MTQENRFIAAAAGTNSFALYDRASISPNELLVATQEVQRRWPSARLHKNDVTNNLMIHVDGEVVGQLDLLNATVDDFTVQGDGDQ